MGISWSSRRRNNFIQNPPPPPPLPPPYYYSAESHPPPPPPPPPQGYYFPSTTPYTPHCTNYVSPPPLPPPQTHSYYYSNPNGYTNYGVGRVHYHPFYVNQHGWAPPRPCAAPPSNPPPYVDHQTAKKIRNYVNVHKDTLRLEVDDHNPDHHLVTFVFDAVYDGSITIFYFAKEEEKCRFVPLYPDAFEPVRIPFQKGVGQKFAQPSGTGIDLGFFELDDLSKSSPGEDVFPLVICAETCLKTPSAAETPDDSMLDASPHMQVTQGVLEKRNGSGPFQIKVVRQILWIDGVRYELRELYGIGSSAATDFDDSDPGKECVICMTEPKVTAVLPCRHMCMCSECAKALRLQSNKCPICRQSIEELIEIKMNNGDQ
ncbi:Zinc finger, RING-type [Sesbania bispinosa]|nr:Zinc finger, RING-type [Sesbania bispinosa]